MTWRTDMIILLHIPLHKSDMSVGRAISVPIFTKVIV